MKKSQLVSALLLFPLFLFSQITIDQNDMPNPGDTIRTSTTYNIGAIDFEVTGNDFTWDFSGLIPFSQSVDTFVSVSETPWLYKVVFLSCSNLAKKLQSFDQFPGIQVTDAYEFYKNSSSEYKYVGYGVTLNEIPIPNKFDEPDVIYHFPLNIGNIDSSFSSHEMDIPGIGYSGGWKNRVNHADGWGTLITPYGSFETLRVKSEITQYDSIYVDSLGGFPVYRNYTEYKWLGTNFGLPLCTVTDDGILTEIVYIDSVRNLIIGIAPRYSKNNNICIYPNPAKDKINIEVLIEESAYTVIKLLSVNGEYVQKLFLGTLNKGNQNLTLNFNRQLISKGLYFLEFRIDKKIIMKKVVIE